MEYIHKGFADESFETAVRNLRSYILDSIPKVRRFYSTVSLFVQSSPKMYFYVQTESPFASIGISDNEVFQQKSLFTDIPSEYKVSVLDCATESINQGNVNLSRCTCVHCICKLWRYHTYRCIITGV